MSGRTEELAEGGALAEAEARVQAALAAGPLDPALVEAAIRIELRRGDPAAVRARLTELVARAPALAAHPRLLVLEAQVTFLEGSAAQARTAFGRALDAARAAGASLEEVAALAGLASVCHAQGEGDRAIHFAEEALALARARELGASEASLLDTLSRFHHADGRLGPAIEAADSARESFTALRQRTGFLRCTVHLGELLAVAGDERALSLADEARAVAADLGDIELALAAALVPVRLALERGDAGTASGHLARAEGLAVQVRSGRALVELALVRARHALLQGAAAAAREPAALLARSEDPHHRSWADFIQHRVEALEHRPADREALAAAAARAARVGEREACWRLHAAVAEAYLAEADRSGSAEHGFASYHHLAKARGLVEEVARGLSPALAALYLACAERRTLLAAARRVSALAGVARGPEARSGGDPAEADRRLALRVMALDRRRLPADLRPAAVRAAVLDAVLELTGAARAFLRMPEAGGPTVTGRTLKGDDVESPSPATDHPAMTLLARGAAWVVHEAKVEPPGAAKDALFARGAVVCVPIPGAEGRVGWLYADHPGRPGLFAPTDVEVLQAFAAQGALAIEHAELLDRARTDAARLAAQQQEIERLSRQLADTLERREAALSEALRRLEEIDPGGGTPRARLVGTAEPMRRLLRLLDRVRLTDAPVVITGESGTGKEVVARIVHEESDRRAGPFLSINCAAIPEELLESELFGHVQGAFTGANRARPGLFVAADGGTLFLDEIGDTPLTMQVKLLRVLQEGDVRPVGAEQSRRVDVRVVTATHRDLEKLVAEGRFRADLYYRLNVIRLHVPPLRERRDDIPALVAHFLQRASVGSGPPPMMLPEALELLAAYDWPGNVRELDAAVRTALIFTEEGVLTAGAFLRKPELARLARTRIEGARAEPAATAQRTRAEPETPPHLNLEELEKWAIVRALAACGGNKAAAARVLGLGRVTLYRKLRAYGLGDGGGSGAPPGGGERG